MSTVADLNSNYNDFSSLSRLRADAREDSEAALKEVAKQFESVFVQMMIKSMREASVPLQGELFHSDQSKAYTDMYDKQLGLELTKTNGIGLADVIVRQLSKTPVVNNETASLDNMSRLDEIKNNFSVSPNAVAGTLKYEKLEPVITGSINTDHHLQINKTHQSPHWSKAEDFIRDSWPHAQRAGEALGVDPRTILAQSVLETGWGKKVHATDNGENSYSLFGIKANNGWQGKTVNFSTLEFHSGTMNRETARFRAYDSIEESYQDYVDFLKSNNRYQNVLETSTSAEYSKALQESGYATDPDYAKKIERIRNSDLMNGTLSGLKNSTTESLT